MLGAFVVEFGVGKAGVINRLTGAGLGLMLGGRAVSLDSGLRSGASEEPSWLDPKLGLFLYKARDMRPRNLRKVECSRTK